MEVKNTLVIVDTASASRVHQSIQGSVIRQYNCIAPSRLTSKQRIEQLQVETTPVNSSVDGIGVNNMGLEEVLKEINTKNIKYVRFQFTDCYGILRCRIVPAKHFESRARQGIGIIVAALQIDPIGNLPEESIGPISDKGFLDFTNFADLETFRVLPWLQNTASVMTYPVLNNEPVSGCPRNIATRQLEELKQLGYTLFSAHEYEFTVIDRKTGQPVMNDYSWASCQRIMEAGNFLGELLEALPEIGIDVDTIQCEHGPGQLEITYMPVTGIAAADNAAMFKNAVKEIAWKYGLSASFMSRPHRDWSTCSAHFNHSLLKVSDSTPVLFDSSGKHGLSKVAGHWIAGVLAHARSIALLMAPTINCIDRFHKDPVVPSSVTWGVDNRMSAMRVKVNGERSTYFENRLGAGGGDPYISLAATVAAGIDGVKRELPLPVPLTGAPSEGKRLEILPQSFEEAIECFKGDDVICKAFGEDFIKSFLALKRHEKKCLNEAVMNGQDELEWARDFFFKYL